MGHNRETQPRGACWLVGGPALGRHAAEEVQSLTASHPSALCPLKDGTKPGDEPHPERAHRGATQLGPGEGRAQPLALRSLRRWPELTSVS